LNKGPPYNTYKGIEILKYNKGTKKCLEQIKVSTKFDIQK